MLGIEAFGPQVGAVVQSLVPRLRDRTVVTIPLYYTAASTDLLSPWTWEAPWNWTKFFASVGDGVGALHTQLDLRARECKDEILVLVGYSQGSMVIRRELDALARAGNTTVLPRVAAVGLIADPMKRASEPNLGTARPDAIGAATLFRLGGAPLPIPNAVAGKVQQTCSRGDVVCDANHLALNGRAIHSSYDARSLDPLSSWLAQVTLRRPGPVR